MIPSRPAMKSGCIPEAPSAQSSPDVHPVRDNLRDSSHAGAMSTASLPYPAEAHGFFHGWCEGKRYTVQDVIGKGSYGVVCAAKDNFTGEKVAIKKITNVFENVADATRILREVKLLRLLKHPDVVDIKHILLPSDPRSFKDLYVVFELMESDLHTVIGANDDLTQDHHKVFLYQLLRGLSYIHSCGVLHRDLKPKNILANSNCKLKICDFGLARPYMAETAMSPVLWTDYVATRWYRAPELCGCFYGRYSQAVDIWSIGCIFAEVLLGKPLFPGKDAVSQLQLITDLVGKPSSAVIDCISNQRARAFLYALPHKEAKLFSHKFPGVDASALDLLRRLLSFDPAERPTAAEALLHPYFSGLPAAAASEPTPVCRDGQFEFELHKLHEPEVRQLIYAEVLHYHPNVAAAYATGGGRSSTFSPITAADGTEDLRRQFMIAEQYGSVAAAPPGAAAAAAVAVQQAQQQAAALSHLQQQQGLMNAQLAHQQQQVAAANAHHAQLRLQQQQALLLQQQAQQATLLQAQQQQAMQQAQLQQSGMLSPRATVSGSQYMGEVTAVVHSVYPASQGAVQSSSKAQQPMQMGGW